MIEVERLHKRFGDVTAVDDVSFSAPDGAVTGLLGPNGAGKTTILRMLMTLMRPDRGQIRIDGLDVARDRLEARRRIGVLPDGPGLYPRLTVREHIEFAGELHAIPAGRLSAWTDEMIAMLDLRALERRRANGFSHGERVKVALASALVHAPRTVMLDEPTNGLDVISTRILREVLRKLREQGKCVLFSSHVMQEVSALCDRVVIVGHGRVLAEGTPDEIRARSGKDSLEEAFISVIGSAQGLTE